MRTEEDIENLKFILYKQEETFKGKFKNKKAFLDIDYDFHRYIASISKNEYLERLLSNVLMNSRRFLNASTMEAFLDCVIDEHNMIFECIIIQDEYKAKEYMQKHIDNIKMRMYDSIIEVK